MTAPVFKLSDYSPRFKVPPKVPAVIIDFIKEKLKLMDRDQAIFDRALAQFIAEQK